MKELSHIAVLAVCVAAEVVVVALTWPAVLVLGTGLVVVCVVRHAFTGR